MNSYLSRCALTTKYMSKAGNQIVCNILFYYSVYIYIYIYTLIYLSVYIYIYIIIIYFFLKMLSIITILFALNSTGRHAYIACNGLEPQKTSLSTSVTFNKICEGKSPINFLCILLLCALGLFLIILSPDYCITLFIRLVRGSRMKRQG